MKNCRWREKECIELSLGVAQQYSKFISCSKNHFAKVFNLFFFHIFYDHLDLTFCFNECFHNIVPRQPLFLILHIFLQIPNTFQVWRTAYNIRTAYKSQLKSKISLYYVHFTKQPLHCATRHNKPWKETPPNCNAVIATNPSTFQNTKTTPPSLLVHSSSTQRATS